MYNRMMVVASDRISSYALARPILQLQVDLRLLKGVGFLPWLLGRAECVLIPNLKHQAIPTTLTASLHRSNRGTLAVQSDEINLSEPIPKLSAATISVVTLDSSA